MNESIITKVTNALEALSAVGAGNVEVTDNTFAGLRVEFLGDLAGVSVDGLTVMTAVAWLMRLSMKRSPRRLV